MHAQTEGNALFVDEVTRMLIAEEALAARARGGVDIPQGVRDVIGRRIAAAVTEECASGTDEGCACWAASSRSTPSRE